MSDRRIQAARRAELTAFVESNGTDGERADLALSSLAGATIRFGFSLRDLVAVAGGKGAAPRFEYETEKLAKLGARIRLRQELRLPARECASRKPPPEASHCICLAEAIDAAIASGHPMTRDEVLKAARQAHAQRWAWLKRKPKSRPEPLPSRSIVPDPNAPQAAHGAAGRRRSRPGQTAQRGPGTAGPSR
jgi:hypothetical protein